MLWFFVLSYRKGAHSTTRTYTHTQRYIQMHIPTRTPRRVVDMWLVKNAKSFLQHDEASRHAVCIVSCVLYKSTNAYILVHKIFWDKVCIYIIYTGACKTRYGRLFASRDERDKDSMYVCVVYLDIINVISYSQTACHWENFFRIRVYFSFVLRSIQTLICVRNYEK